MSEVTVILTTHNRPQMFREALASIEGARVIVVDDGSQPQYTQWNPRHDWDIRHETAIGYAQARLSALPLVETPYLAFLDDDDVLMPTWLPLSIAKMAEGFDVVAASYIETDASLERLRTHRLNAPTLDGLLSGQCPINDGALIRRTILGDATWHPERDTVMMFSLWLALMAKGARFGVVDEPCWYHRMHDANMSAGLDERDAAWRREAIADYLVPA